MNDFKAQGKRSRNKGKRRELELVHILNGNGFNVRRGYVFNHEPDIVGMDGFHVEVKGCEALNVRKALRQSIDDAEKRKDGKPILAWKKSNEPWTVTMLLDDFLELIRKGKE